MAVMFWKRGRIFICYRRDDASAEARNLRDGLARFLGKSAIFMDIDNLFAGERFEEQLKKALSRCDVLLAVVGSRWLRRLSEHVKRGDRDYVREEIAEALRRNIRVIPVLVGREARMPALPEENELPDDIRQFVMHQKASLTHESADRDIAKLVHDIDPALWWRRAAVRGGVGAIAATLVVAYLWEAITFRSQRAASASAPSPPVSVPSNPISADEATKGRIARPLASEKDSGTSLDLTATLRSEPASVPIRTYFVQLSAHRTEVAARGGFAASKSQHSDLLGAWEVSIFPTNLGDKGIWYRARLGPFLTETEAFAFCARLRTAQLDCQFPPPP